MRGNRNIARFIQICHPAHLSNTAAGRDVENYNVGGMVASVKILLKSSSKLRKPMMLAFGVRPAILSCPPSSNSKVLAKWNSKAGGH